MTSAINYAALEAAKREKELPKLFEAAFSLCVKRDGKEWCYVTQNGLLQPVPKSIQKRLNRLFREVIAP